MIRTLLTKILPLLVPAVLFLLWMWLARRRAAAQGTAPPGIRSAPWGWLAIVGILVLAVGLAFFRFSTDEYPRGSTHTSPKYENGRVVPGRAEP